MAVRNALTKYQGPGEIQVDGKTLAEATSVTVTVTPSSTPVNTMKKGFGGRSKGPVVCTIEVENAIPIAGLEVDFIQKCIDDEDITVTMIIGNKRRAFDGYISGTRANYATGSAAGASFTVMAGKPRKS
jgi:hypothetical protein